MDEKKIDAFRERLVQQRQTLLREVAAVETDLQQIADDRESEFEEAAQEERTARILARLDDRSNAELQEIERALLRIAAQRYGACLGCGQAIPADRLAALPATPYCHECAESVERGAPIELRAG